MKQHLKEDSNLSEEKNEEVQAIIDRMPTDWVKWVMIIIGLFMALVIVMGFVIKYPETVDGTVTITSNETPVKLISQSRGKMYLLKANKSKVYPGEPISYIETGVNYRHLLRLDSILKGVDIIDVKQVANLPKQLELGDISSRYNTFIIAYNKYHRLLKYNVYENIKNKLLQQIDFDNKIISNLKKGKDIKINIINTMQDVVYKDSLLLAVSGISGDEYKDKVNILLQHKEGLWSLETQINQKESEANINAMEIEKVNLEEIEAKENALTELTAQYDVLVSTIKIWKELNLIYSPISGEIEYLDFWNNWAFVNTNQELFNILPERTQIIGEVEIPSFGAGKVHVGQIANVKINNYPYDEYGLLEGVVSSISRTTSQKMINNSSVDIYMIKIDFPNNLTTNFDYDLPLDFEHKGTVNIIIKPKRLIYRLFDNLKSYTVK